ncbi:MAG: 3-hydroxyacyl-ACP dehydratase FabZ family protein [Burkholderiaceae bacterium]
MRFLLVDRIEELEPGRRVLAHTTVPADLELFRDHFPGFPVMPGVLLTEMMGQAAAKALDAVRVPREKALLGCIQSATFRDWVKPGDACTLRGTIVTSKPRFANAECEIEVRGRVVAQCKLMFTFMPVENFAPGFADAQLDAFLAKSGQST